MDTNEITKEKIATSIRLDASLYNAISKLATADGRSFSNATERLLLTHPLIEPMLKSETAGAAN